MSKTRITNISTSIDNEQADSTIRAMQKFQEQMSNEAEKAGITSENDVDNWITESRRKDNEHLENSQ